MEVIETRRFGRGPVVWAYAAAALFVLGLARFAVPGSALGDGTTAGLALAAAPHLVLLLGVWPRLNLPRWAAASGLLWLTIDLSSDLLAWSGAPATAFLTVRYVGHLFAAAWIAAIAIRTSGPTRVVGVVLALMLGGYTLISPWVPPVALAPSGPLLVIWWIMVGRASAVPSPLTHPESSSDSDHC